MKLLVLTSHLPYPLDEGGKISQYAFAEKLQDLLDLHYIVVAGNLSELAHANAFKDSLKNAKVHILDISKIVITTPTLGKTRIKNLIKAFLRIFKPRKDTVIKPSLVRDDYQKKFNIFREIDERFVNGIMDITAHLAPDIIQVEHSGFLSIVEVLPDDIKKIFVHHEIQYARLESYRTPQTAYEIYKRNFLRDIELNLLSKYDHVLTFSQDDKLKLSCVLDIPVISSPFPVLDDFFEEKKIEDFAINKIVFIGPEVHEPNYDAVLWYHDTIAEQVYLATGLITHIVGKWSEETIVNLTKPYLVFDGFVSDIKMHNRNSLVIVPLRMGSGIRTKIIYAMAQSLPVISTSIGCEGLGAQDGCQLIIRDEIMDFKNAIVDLVQNMEYAFKISQEGYKLTKFNFSQDSLVQNRLNIYKEIIESEEK